MNNGASDMRQDKSYEFPGQHEGEKIELVIRKHKITLLPPALYIIFMAIMPPVFYTFIAPQTFSAFLENPYQRIFILLSLIYYGFLWVAAFVIWVDYYLDIWIITNERILDVEQRGFFNRVVSELDLERIQDITSQVNGMLATMFGFGDIHIQTAAEEKRFKLKSVPHPVTIRKKIAELYGKAREKNRFVFKDEG